MVFHRLIDPVDKRDFDPKNATGELNAVARLIRMEKKEEAIGLCQIINKSGEGGHFRTGNDLRHLGVPQSDAKSSKPMTQASTLRREGKFSEAASLLNSLLLKNPRDLDAVMMLRLYAQDLRPSEKARAVLSALEKQPHIPASHLEFARCSIDERFNPQPQKIKARPSRNPFMDYRPRDLSSRSSNFWTSK